MAGCSARALVSSAISRQISNPRRDPAQSRWRWSPGDVVESTTRGIWEEFRAALCIPGGNRCTPPPPPPPGRAADANGGGVEEGEDLLSALPDDMLLLILLRFPSAAAAARTSVLSRRWRRLWARLPELRFPHPADPLALGRSRAALAAHAGATLPLLHVVAYDADPGDAAAVLRLAAPRLTGVLFFRNVVPDCRKTMVVARAGARAAIELPCFDKAERLRLSLGYLRLVMPLTGVFAKLTALWLTHVRFPGGCDLGYTLSSARCPLLQKLELRHAQGVSNFAICSESLIIMILDRLGGLQKLTIVAPMLRDLCISECFYRQPVANISAPVLKRLTWGDVYDPRSVQLGELAQLLELVIAYFAEPPGYFQYKQNRGIVLLLRHFQKIAVLTMFIFYPTKLVNCPYLMEATTLLPDIENLHLHIVTCGHAIGTCAFHMLKVSTSIRRLILNIHEGIRENACSPGCVCHWPHDWETKELIFNSLQELNICGLRTPDYDFAFVKRLLGWTPVLKTITINFDPSATVDELLCKELLSLSGPDTCMKIYLYRNGKKVIYTPLN